MIGFAIGPPRASFGSARSSDAVPSVCEHREPSLLAKVGSHVAVAVVAASLLGPPDVGAAANESALRFPKCRGDEACISTSSVANPSKFGPPWTYEPQTNDPSVAWASLKEAVQKNNDKGTVVESRDGPNDYYLRAEFPSFLRGIDDVEFRLIPEENLVTYRSASREAVYVYPIQTPLNNDKNKKRLNSIRQELGWSALDGDIMSYASPEPQRAPDFLPDFE